MGLAKAAELNGYPGPAHVLAMAIELDLSPDQKQRTETLFTSMETKATSLGHALIEQERELDRQFASKTATPESVAVTLQRIGELQAKVRGAHLQAHLVRNSKSLLLRRSPSTKNFAATWVQTCIRVTISTHTNIEGAVQIDA
jgi:hypothetical protein